MLGFKSNAAECQSADWGCHFDLHTGGATALESAPEIGAYFALTG